MFTLWVEAVKALLQSMSLCLALMLWSHFVDQLQFSVDS